jgi:hypothetical protein
MISLSACLMSLISFFVYQSYQAGCLISLSGHLYLSISLICISSGRFTRLYVLLAFLNFLSVLPVSSVDHFHLAIGLFVCLVGLVCLVCPLVLSVVSVLSFTVLSCASVYLISTIVLFVCLSYEPGFLLYHSIFSNWLSYLCFINVIFSLAIYFFFYLSNQYDCLICLFHMPSFLICLSILSTLSSYLFILSVLLICQPSLSSFIYKSECLSICLSTRSLVC